jgi:iron(III) transport system permease protein
VTTLGAAPAPPDTAQSSGIAAWLSVGTRRWHLASLVVALIVAAPIVVLVSAWLTPTTDVWRHLVQTVLPDLLVNTVVMVIGVGIGVLVLGVAFAWLTALCEFPGRRVFDWALMLPLAMPAYVFAFVAVGLLDFSGPVQTWMRASFGADLRLPPIRSAGGVIAVMTLAFYPYVYLLARSAFLAQGRSMLDIGRALGLSPMRAFLRVALPVARPAIAAGVTLALMEALADFGAVTVFNYDTFTTAIYKSWQGLFSLAAAAQLSTLLLLFIAVALMTEKALRGRARFHVPHKPGREQRIRLSGARAWCATAACVAVLALAFVIPLMQLLSWAVQAARTDLDLRYFHFIGNTIVLGALAALGTTGAALVVAYAYRLKPDRFIRATTRFATLGYALPGSVLAVGVMISFFWADRHLLAPLLTMFGLPVVPLLAGSLLAVLLAYGVRFMAVAYGPVDSAFERIKPSLLQAARSLGASNREILWRVSLPLLRTGLFSAAALVFVEVMKEMPATLLLRPFGWDTLATRIFEMTAEGDWTRAALPAVALVLVGLLPVILLIRRSYPPR